jgi:hypothetical protein
MQTLCSNNSINTCKHDENRCQKYNNPVNPKLGRRMRTKDNKSKRKAVTPQAKPVSKVTTREDYNNRKYKYSNEARRLHKEIKNIKEREGKKKKKDSNNPPSNVLAQKEIRERSKKTPDSPSKVIIKKYKHEEIIHKIYKKANEIKHNIKHVYSHGIIESSACG